MPDDENGVSNFDQIYHPQLPPSTPKIGIFEIFPAGSRPLCPPPKQLIHPSTRAIKSACTPSKNMKKSKKTEKN